MPIKHLLLFIFISSIAINPAPVRMGPIFPGLASLIGVVR
jgi:hypothetical protein